MASRPHFEQDRSLGDRWSLAIFLAAFGNYLWPLGGCAHPEDRKKSFRGRHVAGGLSGFAWYQLSLSPFSRLEWRSNSVSSGFPRWGIGQSQQMKKASLIFLKHESCSALKFPWKTDSLDRIFGMMQQLQQHQQGRASGRLSCMKLYRSWKHGGKVDFACTFSYAGR